MYKHTLNCEQVNPLRKERCKLLSCLRVHLNSRVHPVKLGWIKFLSQYEWTWFASLSFRDLPRTYTAINRAKKWIRDIEEVHKRYIPYYLCLEFTKRLNYPHIHLLLGNLDGIYRKRWWKVWYKKYGGAHIRVYNRERGGVAYLCKYVVKDIQGRGHFEIRDPHLAIQLPLKLGRQTSTIDRQK